MIAGLLKVADDLSAGVLLPPPDTSAVPPPQARAWARQPAEVRSRVLCVRSLSCSFCVCPRHSISKGFSDGCAKSSSCFSGVSQPPAHGLYHWDRQHEGITHTCCHWSGPYPDSRGTRWLRTMSSTASPPTSGRASTSTPMAAAAARMTAVPQQRSARRSGPHCCSYILLVSNCWHTLLASAAEESICCDGRTDCWGQRSWLYQSFI